MLTTLPPGPVQTALWHVLGFSRTGPQNQHMNVLRSDRVDPNAHLMLRRRAAEDRYRIGQAIGQTVLVVAVLWWIRAMQSVSGADLHQFAINPGQLSGLFGVLTAPLLHGSFAHLIANSLPLLILGSMARYTYPRALLWALPIIWLASGMGTWLFGRPSFHLGASGIAHGLMFFLFVVGLLRRDRTAIAVALITFFLYGSMIWTVFPGEPDVSWEAHLFGALGGVLSALLLFRRDPTPYRAPYSWELEPDEPEASPWHPDEPVADGDPAAQVNRPLRLDDPTRWRIH